MNLGRTRRPAYNASGDAGQLVAFLAFPGGFDMQSWLRSTTYLCLCCAWTLSAVQAVRAGTTPMTTELVVSGLSLPLGVTAPPGDYNRLFIIEQRSGSTGRIRVFDMTTQC